MTAQQQYDSMDTKHRTELLLKIGETAEEARLLGQRDYVAFGSSVKTRIKGTGIEAANSKGSATYSQTDRAI